MKLQVFALDYDGTIASDGVLDPEVREAIAQAHSQGIMVVLVTGRIRADLQRLLNEPWIFDVIVAENGAVLHFPHSGRSILLGQSPPLTFTTELRRRDIPFFAGECVVEMDAQYAGATLSVIHDLELPLVLAFNRSRLMVLPQAISKATGLREALRTVRLSEHNTVAIGDAENDHELLAICELGVAVDWGSDALKGMADEVLEGEGPQAVAGFIRRTVQEDRRLAPNRIGKGRLHLGICEGGDALTLSIRDRNILVIGDTQSGKSWVAGLLCEQLILQHYCVCVIDPEGEYATVETLPSVVVIDVAPGVPQLKDVELAVRYPDVSVILNLSNLGHQEKLNYVKKLLRKLKQLRHQIGLPHRIVVDEAHYFFQDPDVRDIFDFELGGYLLVSYRASQVHADILERIDGVIVTRASDPAETKILRKLFGNHSDSQDWVEILRNLETGQAALLPGAEEAGDRLVRFHISRRITAHVRHKEKYLNIPVASGHSFVFTRNGVPTGERARTLAELVEILSREKTFTEHLSNHDFSRWIREVFTDRMLADQVREIEDGWIEGRVEGGYKTLVDAVRKRYSKP